MPIPDEARRRAEQLLSDLIERRIPLHVRDRVRMSVVARGNALTLLEHRLVSTSVGEWTNGKVAQFRFDDSSSRWTLYWSDRNGRWHHYTRSRPTEKIVSLIRALDRDPGGFFWG